MCSFLSRWHLRGCRAFSYWCFANSATFPFSEEYKPKALALGWEATGWVKRAKTSGKECLLSKRLCDQWLLCCISTLMSNIKYLHNVTTPTVWCLWWLQEKRSQRESVEMRLRACFCVCDSESVCDPVCVVVSMAPGSFCSLLWLGHSRTRSSSVSDLSSSAQTHTHKSGSSLFDLMQTEHTDTQQLSVLPSALPRKTEHNPWELQHQRC